MHLERKGSLIVCTWNRPEPIVELACGALYRQRSEEVLCSSAARPQTPPVSYRGFAAFPSKAIAAGDTLVSVLTDLAVGLNMLLCGKHMSYLQPPAVP